MAGLHSGPVRWLVCAVLFCVVALLALHRRILRAIAAVRGRAGTRGEPFEVRRVCVIGAGASGIIASKVLLEYSNDGSDWSVDVYEATDQIGGLWRYAGPGQAAGEGVHRSESKFAATSFVSACYASLTSNLSAIAMSLSDFPLPSDPESQIPHEKVLAYLEHYAAHFDVLTRCNVRFQHEVISVSKTGTEWAVQSRDGRGRLHDHMYDAVLVCNGHYGRPFVPELPGLEEFRGRVMHSREYREPEVFSGRRVLIVGSGPSGGEIAADIAKVAESVMISTRAGFLPLSKVDVRTKKPMDYEMMRFASFLLPDRLKEMFMRRVLGEPIVKQMKKHGIPAPDIETRSPLEVTLTITSGLWRFLRDGKVSVNLGGIHRVTEEGVRFSDGASYQCDSIVFCTGYRLHAPFLQGCAQAMPLSYDELECRPVQFDRCRIDPLHKMVFAIHDPTLAFIGLPTSTLVFPMCEMQAHWVARAWKNIVALPSEEEMHRIRRAELSALKARNTPVALYHRRDPIGYTDEVAAAAEMLPPLWKHPSLLPEIMLGPPSSAVYRLQSNYDEAARVLRDAFRRKFSS